ncbi:hypothetical protein SAMN05421837_11831 [Amycolatopsis pretoriensis]|uniref:Uncharacterized protein n=1 Tax=Amycolatopsis pretoriensis TaxID=218821 RepID=A0A1H5RIF5_9PSEU|nr:hypothetical protein [Amycolatopsis pretoriensis]SEF38080.1 hypothetical protein SAMN05421837_11831 [Amycolatopsis pretoriensis]
MLEDRPPQDFAAGHLRDSLIVPADGRFAEQAATITPPGSTIVIVAPDDRQDELVPRLARGGSMASQDTWTIPPPHRRPSPTRSTARAGSRRTTSAVVTGPPRHRMVVDVRGDDGRAAGVIEGSPHIPLPQLPEQVTKSPSPVLPLGFFDRMRSVAPFLAMLLIPAG